LFRGVGFWPALHILNVMFWVYVTLYERFKKWNNSQTYSGKITFYTKRLIKLRRILWNERISEEWEGRTRAALISSAVIWFLSEQVPVERVHVGPQINLTTTEYFVIEFRSGCPRGLLSLHCSPINELICYLLYWWSNFDPYPPRAVSRILVSEIWLSELGHGYV